MMPVFGLEFAEFLEGLVTVSDIVSHPSSEAVIGTPASFRLGPAFSAFLNLRA